MDHTSGSQSVDNLLDRFGCEWSQTKDSVIFVSKSVMCKRAMVLVGWGRGEGTWQVLLRMIVS